MLSGWVWLAAASLVGFEVFDMMFSAFLVAPELFPLVIVVLALVWYFREWFRETWDRIRGESDGLLLRDFTR